MEKDFLGPEQKKLKQQTCRVYVSADWLIPSEKSVCVCAHMYVFVSQLFLMPLKILYVNQWFILPSI